MKGAQKVLNCKKVISYKNYEFKARAFSAAPSPANTTVKQPADVQQEFSHDLEGYKFPFYILKSNQNLYNLFVSDLNNKLNATLVYKYVAL